MKTMKHTKEPWAWQQLGNWMIVGQHGLRPIVLAPHHAQKGKFVLRDEHDILRDFNPDHPDAQRIIECVNALAGVENPAQYIASLKSQVAALKKELSEDDRGVDINYDFHEGRGEDNELL